MSHPTTAQERTLAQDLASLTQSLRVQSAIHDPSQPDSTRLAFADLEFISRREARGLRFQMELLKADMVQRDHGIEHTVVVYGSARFVDPETAQTQLGEAQASGDMLRIRQAQQAVRNARRYAAAREFARLVAAHGMKQTAQQRLYICTGGGPGIMEAANRGAHDAGAPNVGLNIVLPHEQNSNPYITPELNFTFHYFAMRKMQFMLRARALVAFPGGFGTLDELFEVLTLGQTGKTRPVPIVLFDSDFWKKLINFEFLLEEGTISPEDLKLFHFADTAQDAWDIVRHFYSIPE